MKCSAYLAGFAVLFACGAASLCPAATASVSGWVRDSSGVPQIGAEVQVLSSDLNPIASAYTNSQGRFLIASLAPGRYILKAIGPSFLPSQRENVRVRGGTVVNLTLYTLYEVIQWLPAQPRSGSAPQDDWAWTLRSAAGRPLLRWLEDGPLVVDSEGPGATPRLKARIMATGQAGTFGENGERFSAAVEDTPSTSTELLARVDFAPGSNAGMESMLGFRQDLGYAGSVQTVAAVALNPEIESAGGAGLDEASLRSSETMRFGQDFEVNVGSNVVAARMASVAPASAMLPYASIAWHAGKSTLHYRFATMVPDPAAAGNEAAAWLPALAARNGSLTIEQGLHQEIGFERLADASGFSVVVFASRIDDPVIEAQANFAPGQSPSGALFDPLSGLMRAAGPAYASAGLLASVQHRLPGNDNLRLSYANGNALVMHALPEGAALAGILAAARPRRAQTYALALSGTLDGTATQWRASYTWQSDDTVTAIPPFALEAAEPYLNLHFRQPIRIGRNGAQGMEALFDMQNLLAQGYRPYILSDGSLLLFAQTQRSLCAGLAFTF